MRVPFVDLTREHRLLEPELLAAYQRVLRSGRTIYGAELEAFEHELAEWYGGGVHVVGCASGTDAVEIALRACVAEESVVATSALTAPATINAVEAAGCFPTLDDVDPRTRNVESVVGPVEERGVDATVAVDLYGLPCSPARDADVIIRDCAHSMGAEVNGVSNVLASELDAAALSFYCTKNLGATGDGGAIVTRKPEVARRARLIRHYGGLEEGDVSMRGQNSRLCEMQAAALRVKLPHLRGWVERRREIAARYSAELAGKVTVPTEPEGMRAAWHVYVVEHPERDRLKADLEARGVETLSHYPKAIHEHSRWKHLGEPGDFPVAERLAREVLSLPLFPYLSEEEQEHVIKCVREVT